jgi:hypothetical protein
LIFPGRIAQGNSYRGSATIYGERARAGKHPLHDKNETCFSSFGLVLEYEWALREQIGSGPVQPLALELPKASRPSETGSRLGQKEMWTPGPFTKDWETMDGLVH